MSALPNEKQAIPLIEDLIGEFLALESDEVKGTLENREFSQFDFTIKAGRHKFLVEYKRSASAAAIAGAAEQLKSTSTPATNDFTIPLVAVPYMGKVGREICEKIGMSWLDLSGNAKFTAPNLRIWIEGRPNKYTRRGRPSNLFAPKSSRIVRQLLLSWSEFQTQADLVRATLLDDGYVSKLVRRMVAEKLAIENESGAVRPKDPSLLLDAWKSAYDFSRHQVVKGHVAMRSGEELVQRLASTMTNLNTEYAVTGLAAAWLYTHFASHRICTFYLRSRPARSFLSKIEFHDEEKGANTWFVVPNDEGVFDGCKELEGVRCVSEVQTYLDLKGHPERAKDAAEEMRKSCFDWEVDGQ